MPVIYRVKHIKTEKFVGENYKRACSLAKSAKERPHLYNDVDSETNSLLLSVLEPHRRANNYNILPTAVAAFNTVNAAWPNEWVIVRYSENGFVLRNSTGTYEAPESYILEK